MDRLYDVVHIGRQVGRGGVIAKRLDLPYQSGNRDGMQKIKRHAARIAWVRSDERKAGARKVVGSLLLGVYGDEGSCITSVSCPFST